MISSAVDAGPGCHFFEAGQQGRRIPAIAAERLDVAVELVDEGGHRKLGAVVPGLGEDDIQILAHPVDREAEVILAFVHGLVAIFHLPGTSRSLGDDLDHLLDVEPCFLAEMDSLCEPGRALRYRSD